MNIKRIVGNNKRDSFPVDIVITWVDGNDPRWLEERNKYKEKRGQDGNKNRYRDWDILKYWFRSIEINMPWVNKIYFVTWGHLPAWLNTENKRLVIVNHEDYIPSKYLPTFSSRTIELNLHRIKGLSDHFIYFNDDVFLLRKVQKSDYFVNGFPCDMAIMRPISYDRWTIGLYTKLNEMIIIGDNFNKYDCVKKNFGKFFSLKYGRYIFENICNMMYENFTGFRNTHSAVPLLKSTFTDVWEHAENELEETCIQKFRSCTGVNPWLLRHWQYCKGNFYPKNEMSFSVTCSIGSDDEKISKILKERKYYVICFSDDVVDIDFEKEKSFLQNELDRLFPSKSSFEKS